MFALFCDDIDRAQKVNDDGNVELGRIMILVVVILAVDMKLVVATTVRV